MKRLVLAFGVACLASTSLADEKRVPTEKKQPKITKQQIALDAAKSSSSSGVWVPMVFMSVVTSLVAVN